MPKVKKILDFCNFLMTSENNHLKPVFSAKNKHDFLPRTVGITVINDTINTTVCRSRYRPLMLPCSLQFYGPSKNYRNFNHEAPQNKSRNPSYILFCLQLSLIYGIIKISGEEKNLAIGPNPQSSFLCGCCACSR